MQRKHETKLPVLKHDNFIKQVWDVMVSRHRTRKALRLLAKETWSIEFLEAMLIRAAKHSGSELSMIIRTKTAEIEVSTVEKKQSSLTNASDDSIFDHLDDDVYINAYLKEINARKGRI